MVVSDIQSNSRLALSAAVYMAARSPGRRATTVWAIIFPDALR